MTCSDDSVHLVHKVSNEDEGVILPLHDATKVGVQAPTNEEAKGMDVDIRSPQEEDNGDDEIPKTQDDRLSLWKST